MKTTTMKAKTANLSKDQWDVLEGMDIEPEDLAQIDGTSINLHGEAWTDGEVLVFVNCPPKFEAKFVYYMGAERESEITARWHGVTVYAKIDTSRLTRYLRRTGAKASPAVAAESDDDEADGGRDTDADGRL